MLQRQLQLHATGVRGYEHVCHHKQTKIKIKCNINLPRALGEFTSVALGHIFERDTRMTELTIADFC